MLLRPYLEKNTIRDTTKIILLFLQFILQLL